MSNSYWSLVLFCGLLLAFEPIPGLAKEDRAAETDVRRTADLDGSRDFDFEIGVWDTHLRRLENPLSGTTKWLEYRGTSTVRKILGGRANLVELEVEGPTGRIEGLSLRLYNPESRQWSLNFANIRTGVLTEPVIGRFSGGRGEFYGQETFRGRAIFVRFVITQVTSDQWRFEQAFSDDGGRTWETNWIAIDTRRAEPAPAGAANGQAGDKTVDTEPQAFPGSAE